MLNFEGLGHRQRPWDPVDTSLLLVFPTLGMDSAPSSSRDAKTLIFAFFFFFPQLRDGPQVWKRTFLKGNWAEQDSEACKRQVPAQSIALSPAETLQGQAIRAEET